MDKLYFGVPLLLLGFVLAAVGLGGLLVSRSRRREEERARDLDIEERDAAARELRQRLLRQRLEGLERYTDND